MGAYLSGYNTGRGCYLSSEVGRPRRGALAALVALVVLVALVALVAQVAMVALVALGALLRLF